MIKNDNWIRAQCVPPEYVITKALGGIEYASEPLTAEQMRARYYQDLGDHTGQLNTMIQPRAIRRNQEPRAVFERDSMRRVQQVDLDNWKPMIEPFVPEAVRKIDDKPAISFGVTSFGYDLRIQPKFKIFTNINSTVIDPKNFDPAGFVDFEGDVCVIPPHSFVLAASVEYLRIPSFIQAIVLTKSTYARCGINCIATPLNAGWEGYVTLEFSNSTPLPAKLYAHEGAAQVFFFEGESCSSSYSDRQGRYHQQVGDPVVPKV